MTEYDGPDRWQQILWDNWITRNYSEQELREQGMRVQELDRESLVDFLRLTHENDLGYYNDTDHDSALVLVDFMITWAWGEQELEKLV